MADRGFPLSSGKSDRPQRTPNQSRAKGRSYSPAASNRTTFVEAADPEDGIRKVIEVVRKRILNRFGFGPIRDVQVLCPMNRAGLGARALNVALQEALNPSNDKRSSAVRGKHVDRRCSKLKERLG